MVQLELAGIVPAVMVMDVVPATALRLWPTQVLLAAGDAATVNPAPIVLRLSVKLLIVAACVDGLLKVMVSVLLNPAACVAGAKALVTEEALTVKEAVVPVPLPRLVTKAPSGTVLV